MGWLDDMRARTYDAAQSDREADRAASVGASEVPAILGVEVEIEGAIFASPYSLAAVKLGLIAPARLEDVDAVQSGIHLERGIGAWYAAKRTREAGSAVEVEHWPQSHRVRHASRAWLRCTPDFVQTIDGEPALLQVKNVSEWSAAAWRHAPPLPYQIQVQAEMAITGSPRSTLCACIGGQRLAWFDLERDDRFIEKMLSSVDEFWGMVARGEAPPVDGSVWTADALAERFRTARPEKIEPLAWEMVEAVTRLQGIKAEIAEREKSARKLENQLKEAIGTAGAGQLPNGSLVTWLPDSRGIRILRIKQPKRR